MVKIPPVGTSFSVLDLLCEGKEKFFGEGLSGVFALVLLDEGVGRGGSGQSVISVLCVTGWKVAKEMMDADLLGPA